MMHARSWLVIVALLIAATAARAADDDMNKAFQRYGFNSNADYETLLRVIQEANADRIRDPKDVDARVAMATVGMLATPEQRLRLYSDFSLAQPDLALREEAALGIKQYLLSGGSISDSLKAQLATALCAALSCAQHSGRDASEFVRDGIDALLLLGDDRGLDAFLTNTEHVRNLKLKDHWQDDSPPETFDQLVAEYTSAAAPSRADQLTAAIYRLMARRRRAGELVQPRQPIVNVDELLHKKKAETPTPE
jgi:hypothetical protein